MESRVVGAGQQSYCLRGEFRVEEQNRWRSTEAAVQHCEYLLSQRYILRMVCTFLK
jgi:hypothetical protein